MVAMKSRQEQGIVLVSTLFMIVAVLAMIGAYFIITRIELATTKSTSNSAEGFFAAEAGLNLRAEQVRLLFLGYNRPAGSSPTGSSPCEGGDQGSGDFQCQTFDIGKHQAHTYVIEDGSNPINTTIPQGELYQNLNAQEYRYTVRSTAVNTANKIEAILDLRFKSRLVPLFQFVAFYNKDLEVLPGPQMNLSGPIHTNGDLYMNAGNRLRVDGQVSTANSFFRGRKNNNSCSSNPVEVRDPTNWEAVVPSCGSRVEVLEADVNPWNGMIQLGVDTLTVPEPEELDPVSGNTYWDLADLRLVLNLTGANAPDLASSATGVEVRNVDGSVDAGAQAFLDSCSGSTSGRAVNYSNTFFNNRESSFIHMLEVDMLPLFNCLHQSFLAGGSSDIMGAGLDDTSEGGLVFHFSVDGPNSADSATNYGVRVRNGSALQSNLAGAGTVQGLTIVSDQAFYVHGDYNSSGWIPAAFLVDSINPLSNNWDLSDANSTAGLGSRTAADTTANVAILAGTDSTGGIEGVGGQGGSYNGGLENYPRFHESWSGRTWTYRGSFVSLNTPRHADGAWVYGNPQYQAPNRDWDYDVRFNDAANLPPLSPRFVYLRQELFVREFEQ